MALDLSKQVQPVKTPWGEAWNHNELVLHMNAILMACGIDNEPQRIKMTAHAIFASGWKQNCWHYNAWGVKIGTWKGNWYTMGTLEADQNGEYYSTTASWRAFGSWCEAVQDYLDRIGPDSWNQSYRNAWGYMQVEGAEADSQFWAALGDGGYYTDQQFGPDKFASLCDRVRQELASATEADLASAKDWAAVATGDGSGSSAEKEESTGIFPFLVAAVIVVIIAAAVTLYLVLAKGKGL